MKPVYVTARALASGRALSLDDTLAELRGNRPSPAGTVSLSEHGTYPYWCIRDAHATHDWESRASALVRQVTHAAGANHTPHAALFVATSSQDGDSARTVHHTMDLHALSQRIGAWLNWQGSVFLVSSACTSSMQALLSAWEWLQSGQSTEALVLGLELDNGLTLGGFAALQLLSPSRSKPFGADRDGLVLGEAVAALRLSTTEPAPWVLRGGAHVVDGTHPTGASAQTVALMCQRALALCGVAAQEIDLVKVQAAGSPGNDAAEAQGLRMAFDALPALISLKPLIGHCMGASGVAEIALLLALLDGGHWPQPASNLDPTLDVQLAQQPPSHLRYVMATILGFGGSHAAVVLERRTP